MDEAAAQVAPVTVSVATDGTPGNNNSLVPAMSATGRFVTFMSFASNLVANDTNGERGRLLAIATPTPMGCWTAGAVATSA